MCQLNLNFAEEDLLKGRIMGTNKSRGRPSKIITDNGIVNVIYQILWKNTNEQVKFIQSAVREYLIKRTLSEDGISRNDVRGIRDTIRDIDEQKLPGTSAITKYLAQGNLREQIEMVKKNAKGLDRLWSVAACHSPDNIPIKVPTEMFPFLTEYVKIYRVQTEFSRPDDNVSDDLSYQEANYENPLKKLTVRKAEWMSILYPFAMNFVKKHVTETKQFDDRLLDLLSDLADLYVHNEIRNQILKRTVDSFEIDQIIFGKKYSCFENLTLAIREAYLIDDPIGNSVEIRLIQEQQNKNDKKELK